MKIWRSSRNKIALLLILAGIIVVSVIVACFVQSNYATLILSPAVPTSPATRISYANDGYDVIWAHEPEYEFAGSYSSGIALIKDGTQERYIDKMGEQVLTNLEIGDYIVTDDIPLSEGRYFNLDDSHVTSDIYDDTPLVAPLKDEVSTFLMTLNHGLARFNTSSLLNRYGVSRNGSIVNMGYDEITYFEPWNNNHLLTAKENGLDGSDYGYRNRQDAWYYVPQYGYADDFVNGYSLTGTSMRNVIIHETGRKITTIKGDHSIYAFHESIGLAKLLSYPSPDEYYFIDLEGNKLYGTTFQNAKVFNEGYAPVCTNGKWGYIDASGNFIVEPMYIEACNFYDGYAVVKNIDGKYGVIDKNGIQILRFSRDEVPDEKSNNGLFIVKRSDGKHGIIDIAGKWRILPMYSNINDVTGSGQYYTLTKKKTFSTSITHDYLEGFYIPESNTLIDAVYDRIQYVDNDAELVIVGNGFFGWHILDMKAPVTISEEFFGIGDYSEGLFPVQRSATEKWGYVNRQGECVISPQFDSAKPFTEGLAAVEIDGKWGYIANPVIYDTWIKDEYERAESLGFHPDTASEYVSCKELLDNLSILDYMLTQELHVAEDLYSSLNLMEYGIGADSTSITREQAAAIAGLAAESYGMRVYCLLGFIADEDDIRPQYSQFANFAVSFGLFDTVEARLTPKARLSHNEMLLLMLRLYEICIDTYE